MPTSNLISDLIVTSGGGTVNLTSSDLYNIYRVSGTATLASSYTIQPSGSFEIGDQFIIQYTANLTLGANTLTIFSKSIPQSLAAEDLYIICLYNGSSWDVKINLDFSSLPVITGSMIESATIEDRNLKDDSVTTNKIINDAVTTSKILDSNITTSKIADGNVTLNKLESNLKKEVLIIPVSFETDEQSENTIKLPYDCILNSISYTVIKEIAGTDNGTVVISINGVNTTPSTITLTASTTTNSTGSISLTADNAYTANQNLKLTTSKTTEGGKLILSLFITRS